MIYTVKSKDGEFISRNFNTYEEAESFARESTRTYGVLEIYKYWADGDTELITTIRS